MANYHVSKGEAWNLNVKVDVAAVIRGLGVYSLFTHNLLLTDSFELDLFHVKDFIHFRTRWDIVHRSLN